MLRIGIRREDDGIKMCFLSDQSASMKRGYRFDSCIRLLYVEWLLQVLA